MLLQDILDVAIYETNVATGESSVATYATCCDLPVATFVAYVATSSISCSNIWPVLTQKQRKAKNHALGHL